jgi:uncharacterized membrane protein (DUF4010 family)
VPVQDTASGLPLLIEGLLALGVGLVIGIEREHRHVDDPDKRVAVLGARTFALLGLTGWLAALLAERATWLAALLLGFAGVLVVAKYVRETAGREHLGITTELAAVLTLTFGWLVHGEQRIAVALTLVTTLVLISKPWTRVVVPQLMRTELLAALQFLIIVLIVLPLLPKEPLDPWGILPPQRIAKFVVLVASVGFVGYILTRLLGEKRAAALTGVVGGLASSTAVTVTMAQRVGRDRAAAPAATLTTLAANAVLAPRVVVIAAVVAPPVALGLAAPLGAYLAVLVVACVLAWRDARRAPAAPADSHDPMVRNPFALLPALKWGALLCIVFVLAYVLQRWLGEAGLLITAAVAGLTDVDAVTLTSAGQAHAGTLPVATAQVAILLAVLSNSVVKIAAARAGGGAAYARRIGVPLGAAVLLGLGVALLF